MKNIRLSLSLHALPLCLLFGLTLLWGGVRPVPVWAQEAGVPPPPAQAAVPVETPTQVWQEAVDAVQAGDLAKASSAYLRYYEKFRGTEQAEEALWLAAQNLKQLTANSAVPQWDRVRDIFRRYGADFSKAKRAPEAYFEVGYAHYRMRFYREALIYFKLFLQRYPDSPLRDQVLLAQADTLFAVGRVAEALDIYKKVSESGSEDIKAKALMGLGEIMAASKDPVGALQTFARLFEKYPDYHHRNPDLLRKLGFVYLRLGKEEDARRSLFHYLNLAENPPDRGEILFELGESYLRGGDGLTALKLYERILEDSTVEGRIALLARFRRAESMDSPERRTVKGQQASDLKDPEGDKPFLAVIEAYPDEAITQDARRALFLRYQARNDTNSAADLGWSYLQHEKVGLADGKKENFSGKILNYLGEGYLARKEYDKLYQLYLAQHRHVGGLDNGRFLYLVGQALESLSLLDQASVVYFRAQGLPLSDDDKADLYSRRTEVYLRLKNLAAAERVLRYVQTIYKDTEYLGEFDYLTGKLNELQGKKKEALAYYAKATAASPVPPKIKVYVEARLRMLASLGLYGEGVEVLSRSRQKQWLEPEALQGWYRVFGDGLLGQQEVKAAMDAYLAGVNGGMPKESKAAQQIHLQLGDLYRKAREMEKGRGHLQKAQAGPDELLKKKAKNILNQIEIDLDRKPRMGGR
ncbi:tetratricopeptide repeat protein [Thiovibrio frasassiensis]|uniref:Tetratricopeptide repeat protein n=1 Tax=Thiovibrio frasassiensis TaxID=2984131 RepID=A0A9X4MGX0_9BACT|nr:tetratricopeptide repeat protein [Thiovibrio frasassiensis]MDG4477031.1 tetratricopeptide repeat protein [Thiovibrio frasassiensis]